MTKKDFSISAILDVLPAIQSAVRVEVAARIDRGEPVAGRDYLEDVSTGLDKTPDPLTDHSPEAQMPRLREDAKLRQDGAKSAA